jgi:hypothetical protein
MNSRLEKLFLSPEIEEYNKVTKLFHACKLFDPIVNKE